MVSASSLAQAPCQPPAKLADRFRERESYTMKFCALLCMASIIVLMGVESFAPNSIPRFAGKKAICLSAAASLDDISLSFESALEPCRGDVTKNCKVRVGPSSLLGNKQLGLVASSDIKKGETVLAIPYDDMFMFTPDLARKTVLKDILPEGYDGWTGDAGLIALLLLNEVVKAAGSGGVLEPKRSAPLQKFIEGWVSSLPSPESMDHPLLWSESDQEVLQSSSTNKIYRALDDIEEDATWLEEKVWSKDRATFPKTVTLNGNTIPCFSAEGYTWAMALVNSRAIFVGGTLRLMPMLDVCNHDDKAREIEGGFMGTFGTTKGAVLKASRAYKKGEEVFCSYGPKSAADYLLDNGFCPDQVWKTSVSELRFEVDSEDIFYDDKMDILEFDTYDQAPMDPVQSFDLVSEPGREGRPDPAMVQFVRFCKLGGQDAFLLESLFRKDAWGFMADPVSEPNELAVTNAIIEGCKKALDDFAECPENGPEVCTKLREAETTALTRTMEYLERDKQALDLKEYYQERRLKDLGLDSDWNPDEDNDLLGYGQSRAPGGADYDW